MANDIEYCAMMDSLPVNSKAMLARLNELMDQKETNCLAGIRDDWHVKTVMWMLMSQVFGQLATIDMHDLWGQLYEEYTSKEV
jgi:hypothetical protein